MKNQDLENELTKTVSEHQLALSSIREEHERFLQSKAKEADILLDEYSGAISN